MNKFKHNKTIITESKIDFAKLDEGISFNGEVAISVTIAVPKEPEAKRMIICTIEITMGQKDVDNVSLHAISQSSFDIEGDIEKENLQKDAQVICYPEAARITKNRIADITRLHVGVPINVPIPQSL